MTISSLSLSPSTPDRVPHWPNPFRRHKDVSNDNIFGREKENYRGSVRDRDGFLRRTKGCLPSDSSIENMIIGEPSNVKNTGLHLCRDGYRIRR